MAHIFLVCDPESYLRAKPDECVYVQKLRRETEIYGGQIQLIGSDVHITASKYMVMGKHSFVAKIAFVGFEFVDYFRWPGDKWRNRSLCDFNVGKQFRGFFFFILFQCGWISRYMCDVHNTKWLWMGHLPLLYVFVTNTTSNFTSEGSRCPYSIYNITFHLWCHQSWHVSFMSFALCSIVR